MLRGLSILFFLLLAAIGLAQPAKIIFDHYGPEEGFASRTSRAVVKTHDGMVWITTDDGLARFDSKNFRFFKHIPGDSNSIASNFSDEMIVDKRGNIWLVAGTGLDIFYPGKEQFTHCSIWDGNRMNRAINPEALYYDSAADRVWVSTWLGLYYSEYGTSVLKKAKADAASEGFSKMVFHSITMDRKGQLWMGNTYGFFSYDPVSGHFIQYHVPGHDPKIANDEGVYCLYITGETVWIGTWLRGLVSFDMRSGVTRQYFYSDHKKIQNGITCISQSGFPGQENLLWISATNFGFGAFNMQTGSFVSYATDLEMDKYGIKGMTNRIYPTKTEGVWIAAEDGLHRYDRSKQLFSQIDLSRHMPALRSSLPIDNICFSPTVSGKDSLCWFLVPYAGIYGYDSSLDQLTTAAPELRRIPSVGIYTLQVDRKGVLWVCSRSDGLTGYNIKDHKIVWKDNSPYRDSWDGVSSIFEDSRSRLWLATFNGLYLFDREKASLSAVASVNSMLENEHLSKQIAGIDEDGQGRIWFCSSSGRGLADAVGCYEDKSGKIKLYHYARNGKEGFPADGSFGNLVCSNKEIYVATPQGLMTFNTERDIPEFKFLSEAEGLINNVVAQVLKDGRSRIWCSTAFGLSCYLPDQNFFINYSHASFNIGPQKYPSMYRSPYTGNIYLGQQGSIDFFSPLTIAVDKAPDIRFTSLMIFNKPWLKPGKPLAAGDLVRLDHRENSLSVEFAAMSFSNSADNRYAWRLEGLEKDWNISKNNIASYNNLAPGKYKLLVKASNSSGNWTVEPEMISFIIRPPFWRTWWFITIVVLLFGLFIYTLARLKIRSIREKFSLRNKIAIDLHDEIGSTLTSIHILSNVSSQALETRPQQAKAMLEQITAQSKTIQQNMSDIVWAIRPDNDKIENLVVRMREYSAQTLEPLNIKTTINIDESLLDKALSLQARKEVLLIFKEAVNNISKHAGATMVHIVLERSKDQLRLRISDNGSLKDITGSSGTGNRSMKQRAMAISGRLTIQGSDKGTTVTLDIPLT